MRVPVIGRTAATGSAVVVVVVLVLALRLLLLRFAVIVLAAGGVIVIVGLRTGCAASASWRWRAVAPFPTVLLRLGQAVVGLLHADPVPGLGAGRELEARIAQQPVGDELGGVLPAFGIALASPGVVLQRAGQNHASDRGLDEIGIGLRDPVGRIADLASVARKRLAGRVGTNRQAEREAPEEGLVAQQRGHAGADPAGRLAAGGHYAASRSTAGLPK